MVGEEVRSVGRCGEFVVGILIGRRNSSQNTNAEVRTTTCTTEPTLATSPREISLSRRLAQKRLSNLHLLAAASVLVRNLT